MMIHKLKVGRLILFVFPYRSAHLGERRCCLKVVNVLGEDVVSSLLLTQIRISMFLLRLNISEWRLEVQRSVRLGNFCCYDSFH